MKNHYVFSVINILTLCVVVLAVSSYFIYHTRFIGLVVLLLGILCLVTLIPFKVKIS